MIYNGLPSGETGSETCGTTDSTTSQQGNASLATLSGSTTSYAFNSTDYSDPDYRTSDIIKLIETNNNSWYNTWTNNNNYDNLLETTDFCIDIDLDTTNSTSTKSYYMPYYRYSQISSGGEPTISCSNANTYTSKVGLLTMDEVWYAGGISTNSSYYLYSNGYYWLLSPHVVNGGSAFVWHVYSPGNLNVSNVYYTYGARPVVSLKTGLSYDVNGEDGTWNKPYRPVEQ